LDDSYDATWIAEEMIGLIKSMEDNQAAVKKSIKKQAKDVIEKQLKEQARTAIENDHELQKNPEEMKKALEEIDNQEISPSEYRQFVNLIYEQQLEM